MSFGGERRGLTDAYLQRRLIIFSQVWGEDEEQEERGREGHGREAEQGNRIGAVQFLGQSSWSSSYGSLSLSRGPGVTDGGPACNGSHFPGAP